jgi:hypothetical protein
MVILVLFFDRRRKRDGFDLFDVFAAFAHTKHDAPGA